MNIRLFSLSLDDLLIRYYLMMASVIIGLLAGIPALVILALPIFIYQCHLEYEIQLQQGNCLLTGQRIDASPKP